mmetsp:Transcript_4587/g.10804  ORF Transcript_4587/g.10804 Transcript_4587/m.10804 type:complete len:304 (+) Transcript_4587:310-1221(+)
MPFLVPLEGDDHLAVIRRGEEVDRDGHARHKARSGEGLGPRTAESLQISHQGARRVAAHVDESLDGQAVAQAGEHVSMQARPWWVDDGDHGACGLAVEQPLHHELGARADELDVLHAVGLRVELCALEGTGAHLDPDDLFDGRHGGHAQADAPRPAADVQQGGLLGGLGQLRHHPVKHLTRRRVGLEKSARDDTKLESEKRLGDVTLAALDQLNWIVRLRGGDAVVDLHEELRYQWPKAVGETGLLLDPRRRLDRACRHQHHRHGLVRALRPPAHEAAPAPAVVALLVRGQRRRGQEGLHGHA